MSHEKEFTTMELFSGAGGGILASRILGHKPLVAIEWDAYCCQVIRERIADGWFPNMQVHEGDVRLFDPSQWRGRISCINAGFPCQDISVAGGQAGIGEGTRSNLYREVIRIADAVRPEYIFLENVSAIVSKSKNYLEVICKDLAEIGYDAVWTTLPASAIGAKHKRDRWWLLGYPQHNGQLATEIGEGSESGNDSNATRAKQASESSRSGEQHGHVGYPSNEGLSDRRQSRRQKSETETRTGLEPKPERPGEDVANKPHGKRNERTERGATQSAEHEQFGGRQTKPQICGMANDMAHRMDVHDWVQEEAQVGRTTTETENRASRLKALGNGQVPLQAAVAFSILWEIMDEANDWKAHEAAQNENTVS